MNGSVRGFSYRGLKKTLQTEPHACARRLRDIRRLLEQEITKATEVFVFSVTSAIFCSLSNFYRKGGHAIPRGLIGCSAPRHSAPRHSGQGVPHKSRAVDPSGLWILSLPSGGQARRQGAVDPSGLYHEQEIHNFRRDALRIDLHFPVSHTLVLLIA